MQQVSRNTDGPLAEEFSRVLREMQAGKGRSESLRGLAEHSNVEDLKTFVGAMVQADSFGISISQVLRVQSAEMRVKRRQYAEANAQQVPVKIMVPLILCVLPCLITVVMGPAILERRHHRLNVRIRCRAARHSQSLRQRGCSRCSRSARPRCGTSTREPCSRCSRWPCSGSTRSVTITRRDLELTLSPAVEAVAVGVICALGMQASPAILAALVVPPL